MLRKARDRNFGYLRKPQPAPDFRGPAATMPPAVLSGSFLTHPQKAVITFSTVSDYNSNYRAILIISNIIAICQANAEYGIFTRGTGPPAGLDPLS